MNYYVYTLHEDNVWFFSWSYTNKNEALAQVERARSRGTRAVCVTKQAG